MGKLSSKGFFRHPLSTILANEGQVRVLRELSRHGGVLSVTGLADRTALTPQGVRKILDLLVDCGAVAMLGQAKTRLYGIGTHPIMESIVRLFEEEEKAYSGAITLLRECVGENKGVIAAWIYGSVARGEDRPNSDIDIAIVAHDTELGRVTEEVRNAIGEMADRLPLPASIVSLGESDILARANATKWWESLLKEAIVLKGDRPDVLIRKITASNTQGAHR